MTKLEKIDKELDKAREKAAEWQAKVRDLEKQHDRSGCPLPEIDAL